MMRLLTKSYSERRSPGFASFGAWVELRRCGLHRRVVQQAAQQEVGLAVGILLGS